MNFTENQWETLLQKEKEGNGAIDVYQAFIQDFEVMAIISYSNIMPIKSREEHIVSTVFIKGDKTRLTDGSHHSIFADIERIIQDRKSKIYSDSNSEKLEYFWRNLFFVDKFPNLEYYIHGTMSFYDE